MTKYTDADIKIADIFSGVYPPTKNIPTDELINSITNIAINT